MHQFQTAKVQLIEQIVNSVTSTNGMVLTGGKKVILEMQERTESGRKGKCAVKLQHVKNKRGLMAGQRGG